MIRLGLLLASIGRPTIINTLDSMKGKVNKDDKLILVLDGKCEMDESILRQKIAELECNINIQKLPANTGYNGHLIRNIFQKKFTDVDFIHHIDDDDIYAEGNEGFSIVRSKLEQNMDKICIFKFANHGKTDWVYSPNKIVFGHIGNPSGFIPNGYIGEWGLDYAGDFAYYDSLKHKYGMDKFKWFNHLIVRVRPHIYNV